MFTKFSILNIIFIYIRIFYVYFSISLYKYLMFKKVSIEINITQKTDIRMNELYYIQYIISNCVFILKYFLNQQYMEVSQ